MLGMKIMLSNKQQ